jgi:hypothetical protein
VVAQVVGVTLVGVTLMGIAHFPPILFSARRLYFGNASSPENKPRFLVISRGE